MHAGGELEEIGEEAVENVDLIFEGGVAVFGEGGGAREKLRETLAACGVFEDAQGIAAAPGAFLDVHFDSQAGTAFGKLRGQF